MSPLLGSGVVGGAGRGGPRAGWVTIRTVDGTRTLTALIGTSNPEATDGRGGWSEIQRPRRPPAIEWVGAALLKGTLPIILDGWDAERPITQELAILDAMAPLNPSAESPAVVIAGGWPIPSDLPFVVQSLTWGDRLLFPDGRVARAEVTLELMQQVFADVVVRSSPAKTSQQKNGKTGTTSSRAKPRTVTVKRGDTLAGLAAKYLGSASKWTTLSKLNGIRDPNYLKVGQVIKLS